MSLYASQYVGTGTGIWLFDVRDVVSPSARLEGSDISFDAASPAEMLPSSVTFRHWDVKEDLPQDLVGVFDVVHVRFFSFVLLADQVPPVIRRLFNMLKPGGYIQWGDPDFTSIRIEQTKLDFQDESPALAQIFQLQGAQDPCLNQSLLTDLPNVFSTAGFIEVEAEKVDCPPHLAFLFHECLLMVPESVFRKTKNEKMQEDLGRLLPKA